MSVCWCVPCFGDFFWRVLNLIHSKKRIGRVWGFNSLWNKRIKQIPCEFANIRNKKKEKNERTLFFFLKRFFFCFLKKIQVKNFRRIRSSSSFSRSCLSSFFFFFLIGGDRNIICFPVCSPPPCPAKLFKHFLADVYLFFFLRSDLKNFFLYYFHHNSNILLCVFVEK